MNIQRIALAIIAFLIMQGVIIGLSFMVGFTKKEAIYQADVAKVTASALHDYEILQGKLTKANHDSEISLLRERDRSTELQRQLRDKPNSVECVKDNNTGGAIAILDTDAIRVLVESTDYKALPKSTNQSCPFSKTGTVTANLLVSYTACIIGIHNQVAGNYSNLIDAWQLAHPP